MANRTQRQKPGPAIAGAVQVPDAGVNRGPAVGRLPSMKLAHNLMPTVLISPEGAIAQANLAFARLVGHDRRQVSRMWCSDLMLAIVEDQLAVRTLMEYTEDTIELLHGDLWVVNATLTVEPLGMPFGAGLLASFQDRTEHPARVAEVARLRAT